MKKIILLITILFTQIIVAQSFEEYSKKAKQGDSKLQYNLGVCYENGFVVAKDPKKAAYWCKKAYENRYEQAKTLWEENELWKYEASIKL